VTWAATRSFQLGGHRACRSCRLSYAIRIRSLKIVGFFSISKIWLTFGHRLNRSSEFELWHFRPLNGIRGHPCRGFLPVNFQLPMTFRCRLRIRHGTDRQTDNGHQYIIGYPTLWGRGIIMHDIRSETARRVVEEERNKLTCQNASPQSESNDNRMYNGRLPEWPKLVNAGHPLLDVWDKTMHSCKRRKIRQTKYTAV